MDIDSIKTHLQQFFNNTPTVIIGSGLSLGEGISGMWDLSEYLIKHIPQRADGELLAEWGVIKEKLSYGLGLEAAMAYLGQESKLIPLIIDCTAELIIRDETSVISSVINGEKKLALTNLIKHLTFNQDSLIIITPNYDRLIELACELAGIEIISGFINNYFCSHNPDIEHDKIIKKEVKRNLRGITEYKLTTKKHAKVFKPHGSLDWFDCDGNIIRTNFPVKHRRLIITPGTSKFKAGYQKPFDYHREKSNYYINRATSFLIIGYGFNDEQLEVHLKNRINDRVPTLLLVKSLSPNAKEVCDKNDHITYLCESDGKTKVRIKNNEIIINGSYWSLNDFINEVLN